VKKIDKLIIRSFVAPFVMTLLVVVFILLMKQMLLYFDDIIGKGLSWGDLGTLLFYMSLTLMPSALPLAVLMASLITFGNLGEHFELTAIKSLGISLIRALLPLFITVVFITVGAFFSNNYLVPKASLQAYSLLWDIKQKKPALDIRPGTFYNGIPDISIKVNHKFKDGITLKGIIIYDHRNKIGNKDVTVADSGKMYTIMNDQYLKFELFNGYNYAESSGTGTDETGRATMDESFRKSKFSKTEIVLDLSSFGMQRTDTKWFKGNRIMRNVSELEYDMDSVSKLILSQKVGLYTNQKGFFTHHFKNDSLVMPSELQQFKLRNDTISKKGLSNNGGITNYAYPYTSGMYAPKLKLPTKISDREKHVSDSIFASPTTKAEVSNALNRARMVKSQLQTYNSNTDSQQYEYTVFWIQWHKILANSVACLAMFLIGAPLGSIIKKGGLGVPVLVSILFFILYYVMDLLGTKWARQYTISVYTGVWMANVILFSIGMIFLRQARVDARLFDADFYNVLLDKFKKRISLLTGNSPTT
jgi:lipopolysaccharide export system permease protein